MLLLLVVEGGSLCFWLNARGSNSGFSAGDGAGIMTAVVAPIGEACW